MSVGFLVSTGRPEYTVTNTIDNARDDDMLRTGAAALGLMAAVIAGDASGQTAYRKPPKDILDVLDAATTPSVSINPTRDMLLRFQTARYPAIAELARPILRLAGDRIDPKTSGPARSVEVQRLAIGAFADANALADPADGAVGKHNTIFELSSLAGAHAAFELAFDFFSRVVVPLARCISRLS